MKIVSLPPTFSNGKEAPVSVILRATQGGIPSPLSNPAKADPQGSKPLATQVERMPPFSAHDHPSLAARDYAHVIHGAELAMQQGDVLIRQQDIDLDHIQRRMAEDLL